MAGKAASGAWTWELSIIGPGGNFDKFEVFAPDAITAISEGLRATKVEQAEIQQIGLVRLRRMLIAGATTKLLK